MKFHILWPWWEKNSSFSSIRVGISYWLESKISVGNRRFISIGPIYSDILPFGIIPFRTNAQSNWGPFYVLDVICYARVSEKEYKKFCEAVHVNADPSKHVEAHEWLARYDLTPEKIHGLLRVYKNEKVPSVSAELKKIFYFILDKFFYLFSTEFRQRITHPWAFYQHPSGKVWGELLEEEEFTYRRFTGMEARWKRYFKLQKLGLIGDIIHLYRERYIWWKMKHRVWNSK